MNFETGWYFIVLPDHEDAEPIAAEICHSALHIVRHPSGRPFVVAHLPADQVVAGAGRDTRVVAIGHSSATPDTLDRSAATALDINVLDGLAHHLAGSFHLAVSVGGDVRVQGSASGVRRVFHAHVGQVTVLSDRADVLADLGGHPMDDVALAARLLRTQPHPLPDIPVWAGVRHVAPGDYAAVGRDGRECRTARWWRRPQARVCRPEGAALLRQALSDAVDTRTNAGGMVHSDLSGGLDSTPITYFAARGLATVHSWTLYSDEPGGREDLDWARKALPSMPGLHHEARPITGMPDFFEGLLETEEPLDDPGGSYLPVPRVRMSLHAAADVGARLYLNGLGGDHLLRGLPVWDHSLFRRRPVLALRRARALQLWEQRSALKTLHELIDTRTYRAWFTDMVAKARPDAFRASRPSLAWDEQIVLPRWLSTPAADALLDRLRALAREVEPLGSDRAGHSELAMVRCGAQTLRGAQQLAATVGIPFESPFLDDRVVEACFSVRHEERDHPEDLKPLVKAAMRGLLPDDYLRRQTKSGDAAQGIRGHLAHWSDLVQLCLGSSLVGKGIIDEQAFVRHAFPQDARMRDRSIDATLSCAIFLRAQRRRPTSTPISAARKGMPR